MVLKLGYNNAFASMILLIKSGNQPLTKGICRNLPLKIERMMNLLLVHKGFSISYKKIVFLGSLEMTTFRCILDKVSL